MSARSIKRARAEQPARGETDWDRLRNMTEEEIEAAAASDPDNPPTDEEFWRDARTIYPDSPRYEVIPLHIDVDVVKGRARMRWGESLEYVAEADAGDFIYVPPWVPHQEINARSDEPLECVLVRSDQEPVVVNLAIEPAEPPEEVRWIDPNHPQG